MSINKSKHSLIYLLLTLTLAFSMLAACAQPTEPAQPEEPEAPQETEAV